MVKKQNKPIEQRKEVRPRGNPNREPTFKNKEELEKVLEDYFFQCSKNKLPLTILGLCIALGFLTRQSLLDYASRPNKADEFAGTIIKAKRRVEHYNEMCLYSNKVPTKGVIFNMTNNYNRKDKVHNELGVAPDSPLENFKIKIEGDDKSDKGLQKNKSKAKKRH